MERWLWCGPKDVVIYEISLNDTSFWGRIPSTLICPILSPLTGLFKSCVMSSLVLWHPSRIKSLKSQKDDSQGCQCNAIGHPSSGIVSKDGGRARDGEGCLYSGPPQFFSFCVSKVDSTLWK